jgi:hypothetical protein
VGSRCVYETGFVEIFTVATPPLICARCDHPWALSSLNWPAPVRAGRWWRYGCGLAWAARTRTLPWRVVVTLGIGVGGGILASLLVPRLGLVVGVLAAMAAGWGLRFRASSDAVAW